MHRREKCPRAPQQHVLLREGCRRTGQASQTSDFGHTNTSHHEAVVAPQPFSVSRCLVAELRSAGVTTQRMSCHLLLPERIEGGYFLGRKTPSPCSTCAAL